MRKRVKASFIRLNEMNKSANLDYDLIKVLWYFVVSSRIDVKLLPLAYCNYIKRKKKEPTGICNYFLHETTFQVLKRSTLLENRDGYNKKFDFSFGGGSDR